MEEADLTGWAGCGGKTYVPCDQCAIQGFREGHIQGVVRGDIGTQLERAGEEWPRWMTDNGKITQVVDRCAEAPLREFVRKPIPAESGNGFDVNEIRCRDAILCTKD